LEVERRCWHDVHRLPHGDRLDAFAHGVAGISKFGHHGIDNIQCHPLHLIQQIGSVVLENLVRHAGDGAQRQPTAANTLDHTWVPRYDPSRSHTARRGPLGVAQSAFAVVIHRAVLERPPEPPSLNLGEMNEDVERCHTLSSGELV
jgi:hypothetical protein